MGHLLHAQPQVVIWGDDDLRTNAPVGYSDISAIAAGYTHCLVLRSNGMVLAWGDDTYNQTNVPANLTNAIAISAGQYHSLALRSNGTVVAWGSSPNGETNVPAGLSNVVAVAAGGYHSMALKRDGTVAVWGGNDPAITNIPSGLGGVAAISAGDQHCLVLKSNGTVVAWGNNDSGQTNTPPGLTNITAIAAGYHHNLAVSSNGTVFAWNLDVYGETNVPPGLTNAAKVAASYFYSMALESNGTVLAWGQDFTDQTNVPAGLINVTAIGAGQDYGMALTPSPVCAPGIPDNFACRDLLTGTNVTFSVSNVGATEEPGEPAHFGFDAGMSVWYTWTAPFSGGVSVAVNADFLTPCAAVYTGYTFPTLVLLASNSTAFYQCRAVFNAIAGTNYQIALDGTTFDLSTGSGNMDVALTLAPPPVNDMFSNATPIAGNYLETSGSFVGATKEPGEPTHSSNNGDPTFQQTLWWTWTAPTNLGVGSVPVEMIADAACFPPNMGVYTGSLVSALSPVTLNSQTNGETRMASFLATPGVTYQIALGGTEQYPFGVDASDRFGNYRFRFNIRALELTFANVNQTNNPDDSTSFGATLQVTNYGSATSGPLQVQVNAISGVSVLGQDLGFTFDSQSNLVTTNLAALAPGKGVSRQIYGTVPAPTVSGSPPTNGVGYGAYGMLEEGVDTNWFTIDQTLIFFGDWPDLNGNLGPGGGVIRLDPSLTGAGFNPLTNVTVLGTATVPEGSVADYTGRARYANSYLYNFSNSVWTATSFSITNGVFTTGIVTSNTPVTLAVQYSSGGFIYNTTTNIIVLNLPPPSLNKPVIQSKTNITFQIQGVPNRKIAIDTAPALTNGVVWTPVTTNVLGTNGLFNYTQALGAGQVRFFRPREVP